MIIIIINITKAAVTILLSATIIVLTKVFSKKINEDRGKDHHLNVGLIRKYPHDFLSHHVSS